MNKQSTTVARDLKREAGMVWCQKSEEEQKESLCKKPPGFPVLWEIQLYFSFVGIPS